MAAMAYIDDKLGAGEKKVYTTHQHPFVLIRAAGRWIFTFIMALIVLVVAAQWNVTGGDANLNLLKNILLAISGLVMFISVIAFLFNYLMYINEEYVLTNERVIQVRGVFNKQELDSSLAKVNDVQTFQSIFGRIFHYGHLEIVTGNESGINRLEFLSDPIEFKKRMLNAKNGHYGDASDIAPQPYGGGGYIRTEDGERRYRVPPQQPQAPYPDADPRRAAGSYPSQPGNNAYNPNYQPPASSINHADIPAMIQKLAQLRDAGVISHQEFEAKKNDLLRRL